MALVTVWPDLLTVLVYSFGKNAPEHFGSEEFLYRFHLLKHLSVCEQAGPKLFPLDSLHTCVTVDC